MAQYTFSIPNCFATEIRSVFSDTLSASMGLRVLNEQGALHHDWPTQVVNLGDFGANSVVGTNLFYENVDVPEPSAAFPDGGSVYWSFVLVNAGHTDSSTLLTTLNNAAAGIVGALIGGDGALNLSSGDLEIAAGILAVQALLQILTANCDGMVAVLGLSLTAAELAQMTTNPQNESHQVTCPGTDSPTGCGGNSKYTISYVIAPSQLITVPNVVGKSPAQARALIEQLGLSFSSASSQTGPHGAPPVVEGQTPVAGTQVLPGSGVEVLIILPTPSGHPVP